MLVDTAGCSMEEITTSNQVSKANEGEVALICHHVKSLIDMGVKEEDIAVVTPYNLQVELLRLNLRPTYPNLEIKSVDGYQGREKEAVLLSLVRSNGRKEVGFLGETRRLNVAVTRARRHLAVFCDTETVSSDEFLKGFVKYMEANGEVRSAHMFHDLPPINRPDGIEIHTLDMSQKASTKIQKDKKQNPKLKNKKLKDVSEKSSLKAPVTTTSEQKENIKDETAESD